MANTTMELVPVEVVAQELHCSRRQAYAHMNKMGKVKIGHGLVTRQSLEQYKRDRLTEALCNRRAPSERTAAAKRRTANVPPIGKGSVSERYPRIRKERASQ